MFHFDEDEVQPQKESENFDEESEEEMDEEDKNTQVTLESLKNMLAQYDKLHAADGKSFLNLLHQTRFLPVPQYPRNWLISPPCSPPEGWKQPIEDMNTQTLVDLVPVQVGSETVLLHAQGLPKIIVSSEESFLGTQNQSWSQQVGFHTSKEPCM